MSKHSVNGQLYDCVARRYAGQDSDSGLCVLTLQSQPVDEKLDLLLLTFVTWLLSLHAQTAGANACAAPEFRQFDFWVGEWDLSWPPSQASQGKKGNGRNRVEIGFDGCVVIERFDGAPDLPLRGMSVSAYDRRTGKWQQTWVDNSGSYLDFSGSFSSGMMILVRQATSPRDEKFLQRMVWKNITADSLDWSWERSDDEGRTWKVLWPIHYQKRQMMKAASSPRLVGLWDFSAIQNEAGSGVDVHLDSSPASPVIARLDHEGIAWADGSRRSCQWVREPQLTAAPRGCIFTESGYEIAAVAVFDRRGNWLRIALDNGATRFGWVQADGLFHPLADLLGAEKLTYLTGAWNRRLSDSPRADAIESAGRLARISRKVATESFEQPYRADRTMVVQDRLWLNVELLDEVCGAKEPRVIDRGWVPAQSPAGEQWAWFWSRGC